jgi:undecaprenyl-phosphate 4-deoxy-4-formamido-L-arabinose transferase
MAANEAISVSAEAEPVQPYLSVVIPVYNEEANIPQLLQRLTAVAAAMPKPTEVILVDDGSHDRSVEVLRAYSTQAAEIVVVELTRNFGQHAAVMAGFSKCRGEVVITLDADLQNPPEEIPRLVEQFEAGYDVVGTIRRDRDDPLMRKLASKVVNRLVSRGTGQKISDYGCMLRAYSADVVAAMVSCPEKRTFIPALAMSLGRRATEIEVDHAARAEGESKYNLWALLKLNLDLMMGFTSIPLRLVSGLGLAMALAGIVFSLFLLVRRIFHGAEVEGVFTLFGILFFFIGVQTMALGLVGEYLARMYDEVRARPRYLIRSVTSSREAAR